MSVFPILFLASFVQAQAASIEGTVRTGSGDPVAKATVTLAQNVQQGASAAFVTGSDGRFIFAAIPPGQYRLTAKRNGYADAEYGRRGTNGGGTSITVVPGATLKDISLTMTAYGAISGRITDTDGDPVVGITVHALRYSVSNGRRTLTEARGVGTDDRGEYRLFWLPPGQYYIRCGGPGSLVVKTGDSGTGVAVQLALPQDSGAQQYAPIYFPGTADPQGASGIRLTPGADYGGVDFIITPNSTHRVRVTVLDPGQGAQPFAASLALAPRNATGALDVMRGDAAGGRGQINAVPPGSYILTASGGPAGGRGRNASGNAGTRRMGASTPVDVRDQDVDVTLSLSPGVDISGRVTVEGLHDGTRVDTHPVVSMLAQGGRPESQGLTDFAEFNGNDAFDFWDVIEGDYSLLIEDIPKDQYLKSARFGSVDVLSEGFHVDPRLSGTLDIVLSANGGMVSGTALDAHRQPAANVSVTLVPDESRRNREDLYKTTSTDALGRFTLQAIAPGTYTVFAWEEVDPANLFDADFIRRFEAQGRLVHVNENSTETVELIAVPDAY